MAYEVFLYAAHRLEPFAVAARSTPSVDAPPMIKKLFAAALALPAALALLAGPAQAATRCGDARAGFIRGITATNVGCTMARYVAAESSGKARRRINREIQDGGWGEPMSFLVTVEQREHRLPLQVPRDSALPPSAWDAAMLLFAQGSAALATFLVGVLALGLPWYAALPAALLVGITSYARRADGPLDVDLIDPDYLGPVGEPGFEEGGSAQRDVPHGVARSFRTTPVSSRTPTRSIVRRASPGA